MLRVIIFCSSLVRLGPTNVMYNMLEAYSRTGQSNVKFIILTISPELEDSRWEEFERLGFDLDSCNLKPGMHDVFEIHKVKSKILKYNPDIVHSYGFRADVITALMNLPKIRKISSLFNNPFEDYTMLFGKFKGLLMARTHVRLLKKFNSVIVCSNFIKNKVDRYGLGLSTIYTGVPEEVFHPLQKEERDLKRENLHIPSDTNVYIFIGNLIPRKNPLFLIKTFKKLKDQNKLLIVMGDGPLMEQCKQECGDADNIRLIGAQPGTVEYLQISDYYISASFSEGFPTAVLEAMSVGIQPLLSDIAPHKEMANLFSYPCIFKNNDEESLINLINTIESSYQGTNIRNIFLSNLTSLIMQKRYVEKYYSIMS